MHSYSPENNIFRKALFISLALHACVITGMYFGRFSSVVDEEGISTSNSIDVIFLQAMPKLMPQIIPIEEELAEGFDEPEILISSNAPIDILDKVEVVEQQVESAEINSVLDEIVTSAVNSATQAEKDNVSSSGLSSADFSESISSYMMTYQKSLGQTWLNECQKYKNKHGTKDCPRGGDLDKDPVSRASDLTTNISNAKILSLISTAGGDASKELGSHYRFLMTEEDQWSMDRSVDTFNPHASGGVIPLVGFGDSGLRLAGIIDFSFTKGFSWADYSNPKTDFNDLLKVNKIKEIEAIKINEEVQQKVFTLEPSLFLIP